jgi:hypothetical protein
VGLGKVEKMPVDRGQAPKFVIPLEDMTVSVGSAIELECKVVGEPAPAIKW